MKKTHLISTIFLFILINLTGCSSTFKVVKANPETGLFPTDAKLTEEEIKQFVPISNLDEQELIVLAAGDNIPWAWGDEYKPFIVEMIRNSELESEFVDFGYLENYVISNDLGDKIPAVDNRIGLNRLSKYIGNYLLVSAELDRLGMDWWQFSIIVYDPVTSTPKFHASRKGINWVGLDKLIILPVLNSFKMWVAESKKLESEKPTAEKLIDT